MPSGLASFRADMHGELGTQTQPWRMYEVVGRGTATEGRTVGVRDDTIVRDGHGDLSAIG